MDLKQLVVGCLFMVLLSSLHVSLSWYCTIIYCTVKRKDHDIHDVVTLVMSRSRLSLIRAATYPKLMLWIPLRLGLFGHYIWELRLNFKPWRVLGPYWENRFEHILALSGALFRVCFRITGGSVSRVSWHFRGLWLRSTCFSSTPL